MPCPYCSNTHFSPSYLPSTKFNNRVFHYVKCSACRILYIDPLPNIDDYLKMYPPGYQNGVNRTILKDKYQKLPGLRFSYGFQFDLITKHAVKNPKILDYGCGNANFLLNALNSGFLCDGVEFNENHVAILKKEIPNCTFSTITDFLNDPTAKYDVIRLSNVLEHMDNPNEIIALLINKLNANGLLLVEGPIECNFSLALLTRKLYFFLMNKKHKGYIAKHTPTHITFTEAKNQLSFLNKFGLKKSEYKITEAEWPYPESIKSAQGLSEKLKAVIAKISMLISTLTTTWGNTFIYIGKKN